MQTARQTTHETTRKTSGAAAACSEVTVRSWRWSAAEAALRGVTPSIVQSLSPGEGTQRLQPGGIGGASSGATTAPINRNRWSAALA